MGFRRVRNYKKRRRLRASPQLLSQAGVVVDEILITQRLTDQSNGQLIQKQFSGVSHVSSFSNKPSSKPSMRYMHF